MIYKPEDLGGDNNVVKLCVPAGIGDISWIYSKIKYLKNIVNREILLYVAGHDKPNRGGDFVELLPEVKFGGYLDDRKSFNVIIQSLPSNWPPTVGGYGLFHKPEILNISANLHLESGQPLKEWLPFLPTDYHYLIAVTEPQIREAEQIMEAATKPCIAVYTSNMDKENKIHGGWNLWSTNQWIGFLKSLSCFPQCRNLTYLFIGAEYDKDKTIAISQVMRDNGTNTLEVIGKPLGVALECLRRCHYLISYPSGIGILSNVLHVPGVMLLPWILKNLETAYADPIDMGYQRYRAWANPKPEEVLEWMKRISIPQSFHWLN